MNREVLEKVIKGEVAKCLADFFDRYKNHERREDIILIGLIAFQAKTITKMVELHGADVMADALEEMAKILREEMPKKQGGQKDER